VITDRGLDTLGQSLKILGCLREINLNFGSCENITIEAANSIREDLKRLVYLKTLSVFHDLPGEEEPENSDDDFEESDVDLEESDLY